MLAFVKEVTCVPKKKTTTKKSSTTKATSAKKSTRLADVKIKIEHIVPTTQYGHVKYVAEAPIELAKEVGEMLADVIGSLYPPYHPDVETPQPDEDKATDEFNREATNIKADNDKAQQENISADDFEPAF